MSDYPTYKFNFGLPKAVNCLAVSDCHMLFTDGRDSQAKYDISIRRYGEYVYKNIGRNVPYYLDALLQAKKNNQLLLCCGDLLDFYSPCNCEFVEKTLELSGIDYLMCAGNHEFTNYSGQHPETEAEIAEAWTEVPKIFKNDIFFDSKIVGGVNFVAVYNGEHLIDEKYLARFKAEAAKGLPMVMIVHAPFFQEDLARMLVEEEKNSRLFLTCCPKDTTIGQVITPADDATWAFYEHMKQEPLLKLVVAGHVHAHKNFICELAPGLQQLTLGGGYYGCGANLIFA